MQESCEDANQIVEDYKHHEQQLAEQQQVKTEYTSYLQTLQKHQIKQQIDEFVIKYDKWMSAQSRQAEKAWRLHGVADDLKSEMVIEAYCIGDRFDSTRGTSLITFLISSLWSFAKRNSVVAKYKRHKKESHTVIHQPMIASEGRVSATTLNNDGSHEPLAKNEISSLERAHGVSSKLDILAPHERLLMELHYELGYSQLAIDKMLGKSRGTTYHKLNTIIGKLQQAIKVE